MESHELAWAAGFFDGEGWANRQKRGVNSRINQAGLDGVPDVLTRFQRIVGVGRIHGPVTVEGKQPLYYWDATSRPDLVQVVERIGPWLCPVKRAQFERTLRIALPPQAWPGAMSEELAWAGGFFDGEGSTYLEKHRTHEGYMVPRLYVPQSAAIGIAPELTRLKTALGGLGAISGVRPGKGNWRPYRRWRVSTATDVHLGLHLLWPFIGEVKRTQAKGVLRVIDSQPDLPRGNPTFRRGWRAFLPARARQMERADPALQGTREERGRSSNHFRQCLQCVREDAKARRNNKRRP